MVAARNPEGLIDDLVRLASGLETLDLRAAAMRGNESVETRDRLVRTIRSYLLPRLMEPGRPLSVVFAGPTGAGKSTLVNSVAGMPVSPAGPLRPTTSIPVVISSERWSHRHRRMGGIDCDVIEGSAPILDYMAFVDTPDIDSTARDHRRDAETLIDEADVVVFVTSALRYADLVPWEVLRRATSRGAPVINVINRIGSDSNGAVVDMQSRLSASGLPDELIRIPEHHLAAADQMVPSVAVQELRRRLIGFADDARTAERDVVARVLAATVDQARTLAGSIGDENDWISGVHHRILQAFSSRANRLDLAAASGELVTEGPGPATRRARRRWMRANRIDHGEAALYRSEVESAVHAAVLADIRTALIELGLVGLIDDSLNDLSRDVSELFEIVFEEWVGVVVGRTSGMRKKDRPLAMQVLISSGLDGGDRVAGAVLFGIERDRLIRDVSADIRSRLQILYDHVARRVTSRVDDAIGQPHPGDLAERATKVVVSSHFSYA